MMRYFLVSLLVMGLVHGLAQDLYFPPTLGAWETMPASSLGWCQDSLDGLRDYVEETNAKAFLILKDGKIVEEWYFDTFTKDSVWYWASAGKVMTATLVGLAQQEGFLDIDSATSTYLGAGWTDCDPIDEAKITVWNQLTMTSGLDYNASDLFCTDSACLQCLGDPGTEWYYHNAPYTLLTRVVENATGINNINQYFASQIGIKIGMLGSYFSVGYNRLFLSRPRDMARFGLLMLAKGRWNGVPILTDTAYYQAMTTPSQSINPAYGYLWWLNGQSTHRLPGSTFTFSGPLIPTAPMDLIAGLGANDQKLYLVPSQNLIVIRLGDEAISQQLSLSEFDAVLWEKISTLACGQITDIEPVAAGSVRLVPNPAQDRVRVASNEPLQTLTLYDLQGRKLREVKSADMSLIGVVAGTYLLRWQSKRGTTGQERLVVQ